MPGVRGCASAIIATILVTSCTSTSTLVPTVTTTVFRPNIIVILTDDQTVGTLQLMPHVRALARRGVTFRHAFVSNALCCPSRASLLTGLTSGHTGVWTNGDHDRRWGGWPAFRHNGLSSDGAPFDGTGDNARRTVALALQDAGYRTGLFGKYLNHYETPTGGTPPVPPGWSDWFSFVGGNGDYYGYDISDQGLLHHYGSAPRDYSTDVLGRAARSFLRAPDIQDATTPFFLYLATFAPHGSTVPGPRDRHVEAPVPFASPAFDEHDVADKPPYVRRIPLLTNARIAQLARAWNRVYGALRDVDRWVERLQRALPTPVLDRTIILFMSDNGFEWGDHRLTFKGYPYERSIAVPLIIAGPGVQPGVNDNVVSNLDIAPTLLALTGVAPPGQMDGASLVPALTRDGTLHTQGVLLEHLSMRLGPSYCGYRTKRWKYVLYRGGADELYDLRRDPYELRNIATERPAMRERMRVRTLAECDPLPPDWTDRSAR
jgi:N-acetylglucosamine-6-sulfatase